LIAGHPDRASPDATSLFLARLTDYVVAFDSEESRTTKNVPFIEEIFGYPKKDVEVRIKIPRFCYADCEYHGTGVVEDCELSSRLQKSQRMSSKVHSGTS
jgi:hypothetical protein